jgi:small-conductance mechanosensitive channel
MQDHYSPDLTQNLSVFLHNPDNHLLLYVFAAFLMIDGLILIFLKHYLYKKKSTANKTTSRNRKKFAFILNIVGYSSWIVGLMLAVYVYQQH